MQGRTIICKCGLAGQMVNLVRKCLMTGYHKPCCIHNCLLINSNMKKHMNNIPLDTVLHVCRIDIVICLLIGFIGTAGS